MPKYTDQDVLEAVKTSNSIRQVLITLGLAPKGGNYSTFKRLKKRLNLDTSHFLEQTSGLTPFQPKPLSHYLVENSKTDGTHVKERLLKDNFFKHECQNCLKDKWLEKPIPLEIHHVNGDSFDHRLENIQLLCPNCHALTDNYRGKNIKP